MGFYGTNITVKLINFRIECHSLDEKWMLDKPIVCIDYLPLIFKYFFVNLYIRNKSENATPELFDISIQNHANQECK